MDYKEQIISAIKEIKEGETLYDLAYSFKKTGMPKKDMYALFDSIRKKYEDDTNEVRLNIVLDTMDYISGWCDADKRIFK